MYKIVFLLLIFLSCSCAPKQKKQESKPTKTTFALPAIPLSISDQASQINYLAEHYWDNFNFTDTSSIRIENLNKIFSQYIAILASQPLNKSTTSIRRLLEQADKDSIVFEYFADISERILHDPNSPLRNEELYIPVLQAMITSPNVDSLMKLRPEHLLNLALKNRVTTVATDFDYMLLNGSKHKLHTLKSPLTLLMFNNPGCQACGVIINYIQNSEVFKKALESKQLTMLAIFPDAQIDTWRGYAKSIPPQWINGYDIGQKINANELYDIKAIPTLYLLDSNKRILLKDPDVNIVENYLSAH